MFLPTVFAVCLLARFDATPLPSPLLDYSKPKPAIAPLEIAPAANPKPGDAWKDPATGISLRWIPEGQTEEGVVQGFWASETEVTQAQWHDVLGVNPSRFKDPSRPVEQVSWNEAQTFIQQLNTKGSSLEYRIPTENEWLHACQGYASEDAGKEAARNAWLRWNSNGSTRPVGRDSANGWGLHDMLGNVSEWTTPGGAWPIIPDKTLISYCGSSWRSPAIKASTRGGLMLPHERFEDIGLRVMASPKGAGLATRDIPEITPHEAPRHPATLPTTVKVNGGVGVGISSGVGGDLGVPGTGSPGPKDRVVDFEFSQLRVRVQPPPPPYPPLAKIAGIQGTVLVEIFIGEDGVPVKAQALQGPPQLTPAAVSYAMAWRFEPAMVNQKPTAARFRLHMPFRLF